MTESQHLANTETNMQQSQNLSQAPGPGEPIVNEQEQDKEVNIAEEPLAADEKEKGYAEGNKDDSNTAEKITGQEGEEAILPGSTNDPEDPGVMPPELE